MSVVEALGIARGDLSALVVPAIGAGLARFDLARDGEVLPLFRPCAAPDPARPFDLANNLLVPWSNRVSGGGFTFDGVFHPLAPNVPGQRFPLHGDGFAAPWRVSARAPDRITLERASEGPGPYRTHAIARYALDGDGLDIALVVENRAAIRLPHGLGLHPWFPRTPATTLQAPARTLILETEAMLPGARLPVEDRPEWDYALPKPLPEGRINNAFDGWTGEARIVWPERGLGLAIAARGACRAYIVWSPGRHADFFCHEPVTHLVDAHNEPGGPAANGLVVLAPGETLEIACRYAPFTP